MAKKTAESRWKPGDRVCCDVPLADQSGETHYVCGQIAEVLPGGKVRVAYARVVLVVVDADELSVDD